MRIKLVNLNLWFGGLKTWDAVINYLQAEKPDIITLQEVQNSTDPAAPIHLRSYHALRKILGYPYSEYEASMILHREDETAPFGNAIFSKFPLANKSVLWLQGDKSILGDANHRELLPTFARNLLHCQVVMDDKTYNLMSMQGVWAKDVNENTECINLIETKLVNIFKGERKSSFNMRQKTEARFATAIVDFVFTSTDIKIIEHSTSRENVSDHQSQIVVFDL